MLEPDLCMCVRYTGLSFSPPSRGQGPGSEPGDACQSRSTCTGPAAFGPQRWPCGAQFPSGERVVAAAAERAMRGAKEEGVAGKEDDKEGNVDG